MARKLGLDATDVLGAAMRLADTHGLGAVTLAAVAAELGVRAPSLYAHVDGLDGLRRGLALDGAAAVAAAFREAAAGHAGLDALAALADAYRSFATRHPGWYAAAQRAVRPGEDDALYQALAAVVQPVMSALDETGVAPADRVHLVRAVRAALHGFVALEQAGGFGMPESVDTSFHRLVALLLAGVRDAATAVAAAPDTG